jgi:putative ABC transport system permease protein
VIKDYFLLAFGNLRKRKLRSWLTILGIFIGIASIVAFISLGQGLQNYINEQFQQMGSNIVMVMGKAGPVVSPIASYVSAKPITWEDVDLIEKISGVDIASPLIMLPADVTYGKKKQSLFVYGMEPGDIDSLFGELSSFKITDGRQLKESDRYEATIGAKFGDYFDKEISVGNKIDILGQKFTIVGIFKPIGNPQDDGALYIPNRAMKELSPRPDIVSIIYIKTKGTDPEIVAEKIKDRMRKDRNEKEGEESFSVSTSQQLIEMFNSILSVVSAVFIGIASISLLVGGIGIMNTMYTAVLERTREIGIMKAVGAKNSDVLLIFLIESGMLGLVGGIMGLAIGMGISKLVEFGIVKFYGIILLKITFNPILMISVLWFSFVIGAISGVMPAIQASRLKPVDALRHD